MALNPAAAYPGQISTIDLVGYPYGRARNVLAIGDGTGTPLEQQWLSDLFGFEQALLAFAGITPSGTPDKVGASQYLDALKFLGDARSRAALAKSLAMNWPERATIAALASTDGPLGMAYAPDLGVGGGGLWVLQTSGTDVYSSEDGQQWTQRAASLAGASFTNPWIAYGKIDGVSGFLLSQNANPAIYYTSTDGIAWNTISTTAVPAHPVSVWCDSLGLWVMAGDSGAVRTSPTALANTWTARTTPVAWQVSSLGANRIVWNGTSVVILPIASPGGHNKCLQSSDGITWTERSFGTNQLWVGLAYSAADGLWMAVSDGGAVVTSPDGITWTVGSGPGYGATDLAVNGSLWVMTTRYGAAGGIAYSTDKGASWTSVAVGDHRVATAGWKRIVCADKRFMVAHGVASSAVAVALSQRALL